MPELEKHQRLARQFPEDCLRMQRCMASIGRAVSFEDVARAWAECSEELGSSWHELFEDEASLIEELVARLSKAVTSSTRWTIQLIDTGDGSGDLIMRLPEELTTSMNWKQGDILNVQVVQPGVATFSSLATTCFWRHRSSVSL